MMSCIAMSSLPPGITIEFARLMKAVVDHREQIREVDAVGIPETDHNHRLVRRRNPSRDKGVRRIDHWHALEIDVRLRELRADELDVVGHAAQHRVGNCFGGVAARVAIAMHLLDPLQIDDRNDADLQVGILGDVDLVGNDGAVQAFVEEQIRARFEFQSRA